jgi:hypothetical protein
LAKSDGIAKPMPMLPALSQGLAADPPWIEMSHVDGVPCDGAPLDRLRTDGLGHALRRLWSVPVEDLPDRRFVPAEAAAAAQGLFEAAARPSGLAGSAFDLVRGFLTAPDLSGLPGAAVLGHADPNLANYLWDGSRMRIVDFEDAGRSDMEYELGTLVEHLSGRGTDWAPFLASFEVDAARLLASRRLAASLWLAWLLPGGASAPRNPPGTLEYQAERVLALF